MKNRVVIAMLCTMLTVSAAGCGSLVKADDSTAQQDVTVVEIQDTSSVFEAADSTASAVQTVQAQTASAESTALTVQAQSADGTESAAEASLPEDMFTDRDLAGTYDESSAVKLTLNGSTVEGNGSGVTVSGSTVTISEEGVYVFSGTLTDGQIVVAADESAKVQIVLDGVTITNDDSAPIYIQSADKVFVTLVDGTVNTLSDTGAEYVQTDDTTVDGVIFSKDDLVLNGSGTLVINAGYKHGIVGKDDIKITGGTYEISAEEKGIVANDSIRVAAGSFTIDCGDDGLHTSKAEDEEDGYIYIADGTFVINAGDDGIHAEGALTIDGGEIHVEDSYEGLEGATIDLNGGEIYLYAYDDGINATGFTTDGSSEADDDLMKQILGMYEGGQAADGTMPEMPADGAMPENGTMPGMPTDGTASELPSDGTRPERPNGGMHGMMPGMGSQQDGTSGSGTAAEGGSSGTNNAAQQGGRMQHGMNMGGMGMMDSNSTAYLRITGGMLYVNSQGDGLDSNGYFYMEGGTVYVDGPTSGGDGSIDPAIDAQISGGAIIATGSSGMAAGFGNNSTQYSVLYNFAQTIEADTEVTVTDENGNMILQYAPSKNYQYVVFSTSQLTTGTYTITAGGVSDTITVESLVTSNGRGGMQGGRGGMGAMQGGYGF